MVAPRAEYDSVSLSGSSVYEDARDESDEPMDVTGNQPVLQSSPTIGGGALGEESIANSMRRDTSPQGSFELLPQAQAEGTAIPQYNAVQEAALGLSLEKPPVESPKYVHRFRTPIITKDEDHNRLEKSHGTGSKCPDFHWDEDDHPACAVPTMTPDVSSCSSSAAELSLRKCALNKASACNGDKGLLPLDPLTTLPLAASAKDAMIKDLAACGPAAYVVLDESPDYNVMDEPLPYISAQPIPFTETNTGDPLPGSSSMNVLLPASGSETTSPELQSTALMTLSSALAALSRNANNNLFLSQPQQSTVADDHQVQSGAARNNGYSAILIQFDEDQVPRSSGPEASAGDLITGANNTTRATPPSTDDGSQRSGRLIASGMTRESYHVQEYALAIRTENRAPSVPAPGLGLPSSSASSDSLKPFDPNAYGVRTAPSGSMRHSGADDASSNARYFYQQRATGRKRGDSAKPPAAGRGKPPGRSGVGTVEPGMRGEQYEYYNFLLRYQPSPGDTDLYRTVLISNLHPDVTLEILLSSEFGAKLFSVSLVDTRPITGSRSALVTFYTELAVQNYLAISARAPRVFFGQRARVSKIGTPTWPIPSTLRHANLTRCIKVTGCPPGLTREMVAKDILSPPHPGTIELISFDADRTLHIRLCSVLVAANVYGRLRLINPYMKLPIAFESDPCALVKDELIEFRN